MVDQSREHRRHKSIQQRSQITVEGSAIRHLAGRLDVDSPLHDGGDRLRHQLVQHVFPLELHVDDEQQALLGGLIF